ncbi:MAG: hypothetical protein QNJ40_22540 [Xanthomonadales bacterium]|nr:hypothetical protein [Xanthomonadales bacterium]
MIAFRIALAALGAIVITAVIMWGSKELIADRLTEEGLRVLPLEETPDSFMTVPVRSAECQDMESSVRLTIARSQVCTTDADCEVISLGCPFGCATPIQSTAYVAISTLNEAFQDRCAYCLSGCASDPPPAVCRAGQCALERFPTRPAAPVWEDNPG